MRQNISKLNFVRSWYRATSNQFLLVGACTNSLNRNLLLINSVWQAFFILSLIIFRLEIRNSKNRASIRRYVINFGFCSQGPQLKGHAYHEAIRKRKRAFSREYCFPVLTRLIYYVLWFKIICTVFLFLFCNGTFKN